MSRWLRTAEDKNSLIQEALDLVKSGQLTPEVITNNADGYNNGIEKGNEVNGVSMSIDWGNGWGI